MQIITANRLDSGLVVFRTEDGGWSTEIADARIVDGDEAIEAALEASAEDVRARIIVDPYGVPVVLEAGAPVPVRLRERIRAQGPTVAYAVPATALADRPGSRRAA